MKHRGYGRSSKIKLEHHIIPGLQKQLELIGSWPEIKSIIPAAIKRSRSYGALTIKVQYKIPGGLKCLAKGSGSVQEVFFVTSQPDKLEKKLRLLPIYEK